jgi:NAD(P)-dependent dehydrogenase (short-subunit alcohol dehydrogenase family)
MTRRVAFVTGAARGIGRTIALEFADRGYDVALLDVLEKELQVVAAEIEKRGARSLAHVVDLTDIEAAQNAVRATGVEWGRFDVLVNNAAWRELLTLHDVSLESWDRTLRISLTAPAFLARAATEFMEKQRSGVIVNISSINSYMASALAPAYTAAKAGLNGLTADLASFLGPYGVRVVGICPGAIDTEMSQDYTDDGGDTVTTDLRRYEEDITPLGRWGEADEIAKVVAWLASDDASFVTGTMLTADGGWSSSALPQSFRRRMNPRNFP